MYIANRTFTSVHKHDYTKGQRITNARYFFLVDADKTSFDFYPHGKYDDDQEVDPNYGHSVEEYYYPATDIATGVVVGLLAEDIVLAQANPDPVVVDTPVQQPDQSFQGFDGGSGGGAGAGDSWSTQPDPVSDPTPDPVADPDPVAYESAPDPTPDSTPDTSYDSSSSSDSGGSSDNGGGGDN